MYIEAIPNRSSPPAILLRESYREDGKVRKRTLCNLSDWPVAHIEGLRGVLRGGTVIAAGQDAFTVTRSLPHGHVAAALGMARKIGLDCILGPDGNRCRDLVLVSNPSPTGTRPRRSYCARAIAKTARSGSGPSATSPIGPRRILRACAASSKAAPSSLRSAKPSPSPVRCRMAMSAQHSARRTGSASTASLARTATAAATSCWP